MSYNVRQELLKLSSLIVTTELGSPAWNEHNTPYTVFIQIDARALIDAHDPPPIIEFLAHKKKGEIDDFCIKNACFGGSDSGPIIMRQLHVLLVLSALLHVL